MGLPLAERRAPGDSEAMMDGTRDRDKGLDRTVAMGATTYRFPSRYGLIKIEHHVPPCDCGAAGCRRHVEKAVLNAPDSGVPNRPFGQLSRALREAADWMDHGLPKRRLRSEYQGRVPRT